MSHFKGVIEAIRSAERHRVYLEGQAALKKLGGDSMVEMLKSQANLDARENAIMAKAEHYGMLSIDEQQELAQLMDKNK